MKSKANFDHYRTEKEILKKITNESFLSWTCVFNSFIWWKASSLWDSTTQVEHKATWHNEDMHIYFNGPLSWPDNSHFSTKSASDSVLTGALPIRWREYCFECTSLHPGHKIMLQEFHFVRLA
jgi:hypothetical protein